jgi:hypothetical protein
MRPSRLRCGPGTSGGSADSAVLAACAMGGLLRSQPLGRADVVVGLSDGGAERSAGANAPARAPYMSKLQPGETGFHPVPATLITASRALLSKRRAVLAYERLRHA